MSIKDKKIIIAVSSGIISALRHAYDLINEYDQLPAVEDFELPRLAPAIMKSLERKLSEIQDNERFEGLTHEEIVEKKEAERAKELKGLQENAGKLLKSLRSPEPEFADEDLEGEEPDDDLEGDPDDEDHEPKTDDQDEETDEDPEKEEIDQDIDDQDGETEQQNPPIPAAPPVTTEANEELTLKQLTALYNKESKALNKLDIESAEFKQKEIELNAIQARISQISAF